MKILYLTKKLSVDGSSPWLTDDFINCASRLGHEVYVVYWGEDVLHDEIITINRVKCLLFKTRVHGFFNNIILRKFYILFLTFFLKSKTVRTLRHEKLNFDVVITNSIGCSFLGLPLRLKKLKIAKKHAFFLWDFFPIHHKQIGMYMAKIFYPLLKWLEGNEVRGSDYVFLMSDKNVDFFNHYWPGQSYKAHMLRLWGADTLGGYTLRNYNEKERLDLVFGGQITQGRGIEQLLRVAIIAKKNNLNINFNLIGDGNLREFVINFIKFNNLSNVRFVNKIERSEYKKFLSNMDVGLVITVNTVTVPTFPSKVIDYTMCSVPVIACVEDTTDFGIFVEHEKNFGLNVKAGDDDALFNALNTIIKDKKKLELFSLNSRKAFESEFMVDAAVKKFTSIIDQVL